MSLLLCDRGLGCCVRWHHFWDKRPSPVGVSQPSEYHMPALSQIHLSPLWKQGQHHKTWSQRQLPLFLPVMSLRVLLLGEPAPLPSFSHHGLTGTNCSCSNAPSHSKKTWLVFVCLIAVLLFFSIPRFDWFCPQFCPYLLFSLSAWEMSTKTCVPCQDEQKSCQRGAIWHHQIPGRIQTEVSKRTVLSVMSWSDK